MRATLIILALAATTALAETTATCRRESGDVAVECLSTYTKALEKCLVSQKAGCEATLRAMNGKLEKYLTEAAADVHPVCSTPSLDALAYTGADDLSLRVREGCEDYGEDAINLAFNPNIGTLPRSLLACQRRVVSSLRTLRTTVIDAFGQDCFAADARNKTCDRAKRDARVAKARSVARKHLARGCRSTLTSLNIATGATPDAQLDDLLDRALAHSRHFAQLVYPPRDLGPTSLPGPSPVGVRTFALADAARMNVQGTGPRPVTIEVWYPSTAPDVAGVPRDIAVVLGVPVATTTSYRNVARAPGAFPLVLFSHGNNGIRFQSIFFAQHLASHGYIVVSMDHHGNTFVDTLGGVIDPNVVSNRPLDVSFVIDEVLALNTTSGDFFEGAIDPTRIGASGHSFGGYTVLALAGGTGVAGTFTEPRIRAILPQAPVDLQSDAFYAGITIPTMFVGGTIDETTPFPANQEQPFTQFPSGATVVGLAELIDGGHFTFSDFCEVPRMLLGFLGGFDEACEPRHIAWRFAHDIVNYLSLNFFDATLNGDAAAGARLAPAVLNTIDDLVYVDK